MTLAGGELDAGTLDAGSGGGSAAVLSDDRELVAFVFRAQDNPGLTADVAGVITGGSIAVTLPAGTAVVALVPTLTITGEAVTPASGAAQDFTHPVSYTVTAADGANSTFTVTVTVPAPMCQSSATGCSLDVYNRAVAFAASHPTHNATTNWDGWCAALMVQFGGFGATAPSAISAYHASAIVSTDPTTAPVGAFHYWSIGVYGHVGVDLMGQGAVVFMASGHLADSWNPYIGVNSVGAYGEASGATYLGWSMEYNGHGQRLSGGGTCGAASAPNGCALPRTLTDTTGVPDVAFVMLLQRYAADHGYTGPIDGHSDAATWAGVQRGLQAQGYTGPTNGLPAGHTYQAFQRVAASFGYTGPVDGELGPNSFRGFARFLNQAY